MPKTQPSLSARIQEAVNASQDQIPERIALKTFDAPAEPEQLHPSVTTRVHPPSAILPGWVGDLDPGEQILFEVRPKLAEKFDVRASRWTQLWRVLMFLVLLPFVLGPMILLVGALLYPFFGLRFHERYEQIRTRIVVSNTRIYLFSTAYRPTLTHMPLPAETQIVLRDGALLIGPNPPPHHPFWDRLIRYRMLSSKSFWSGFRLSGFDDPALLRDKLLAIAAQNTTAPQKGDLP